jgi:predicted nucleotidyltransferase component of viral defense system
LDFWPDSLTALQRAILEALASRASFFFSGGAALAAFYLNHRRSHDLDLFVTDIESLEALDEQVRRVCAEHDWLVIDVRSSPGFRRFIVRDQDDETIVDLVHETVAQIVDPASKPKFGVVRVDALEDLVANKLCALLGRGDVKDLADLYYLSKAGVDVLDHLDAAKRKDAGLDASTLAYVLSTVSTDTSGLMLREPLPVETIVKFRDDLIAGLLRLAWPGEPGSPTSSGP